MIKHKDYKENFPLKAMKVFGKRGQVALFVLIAFLIVALLVLFFVFRTEITGIFEEELAPNAYLKQCVEPEVRPAVEQLSKQGGYKTPEGSVSYLGTEIQYLCYTGDNYKTCTIQQPMTKRHFERELDLLLKARANQCMSNLLKEYEKKGYDVSSGGIKSEVSLIPGKIVVAYNAPLSVKKESVRTYQNFDIEIASEMYDLLFIAQSIVDSEAKLGDSATELYLQYYPDLKIEKIKLSDGTKIYKLSNVVTEEEFTFASRSLSWPAGYGLEEA